MENKMSKYILLCSLCVVFVAAQNNTTTTSVAPTTSTIVTTTVTVTNTSHTTLNGTTSNPTTTAPTTPTAAPTTPTNNGTNSTSTVAPTTAPTTHTPISTTTMSSEKTFSVSNGSVDCIILKLDAEFTIQYWNTKNVSQVAKFQLPQNSSAHTTGNCKNQIESITVMMYDDSVNLTMRFTQDGTNINLANSTVAYNTQNSALFTDAQAYTKSESGSIDGINAPLTGYYKCDSSTTEKFGDNVTVTFSNMKVTAFNQNNNTQAFGGGTEKPCLADTKTDNIVPIAVGAALAGLVVIVLIAYLIGRRTNRQGYQSV